MKLKNKWSLTRKKIYNTMELFYIKIESLILLVPSIVPCCMAILEETLAIFGELKLIDADRARPEKNTK